MTFPFKDKNDNQHESEVEVKVGVSRVIEGVVLSLDGKSYHFPREMVVELSGVLDEYLTTGEIKDA